MPVPYEKYVSNDYLNHNPTWDYEDSPWKAKQVLLLMKMHGLKPGKIVEVGCGAGGVLLELRNVFPDAKFFGFDIAPNAARFWSRHKSERISFVVGDFLELNSQYFDVLLLLDIVEHVPDPFDFLTRLRVHADYYVFHMPLDLCALSVFREQPLLHVRRKVGHIHYFTKSLALSLLEECDYTVIDWFYTGAAFSVPQRTWRTKIASLPRRIAYSINKDLGVRLLGGETLMALARAKR